MTDNILEAFEGTRRAGSIAAAALDEVTKIISGDTGFYTASQAIIDTFLDKNK